MSAIEREARPAPLSGMMTPATLRQWVEEGLIKTVLPVLPDMTTALRGKRLPANSVIDRLDGSSKAPTLMEACAYLFATDVDMTPSDAYPLSGWHSGFKDMTAVADLGAIRVLRPGTVLVHCDAVQPDGQPVEEAPRRVLSRQLQRLADRHGLEVKVGLESEVVLHTRSRRRPIFEHNSDYALNHGRNLAEFFPRLERALDIAATPVESVKTEGAAGQIEVAFPYGPALRACDDYSVYKHLLREVASEHHMVPTFMAAPATGTGSGLHLHVSLWDQDDAPVFATDDPGKLPPTMEHTIAGLLTVLPELMPLLAPTPNSYRRYQPHSFAPTHFTWGIDNRTCAVRVTGHGRGIHLEVRIPGADANPYLALAAVCAAIEAGLRHEMIPPAARTGDSYHENSSKAATPIPRDIISATVAFENSAVARDAFGADVVRHYATAAHQEHGALEYLVPDTEINRYHERV